MSLVAWQNIGLTLFGEDTNQWEFVCPDCGHVQKPQDFLDLGLNQRTVDTIASHACIRRWTDQSCMSKGQGPIAILITTSEPMRPTFDWNRS